MRETFEGGEGVPVQDEVADVDDSLVKMSDIADEDFSEDSDDEDSEDDTSTSTRSERGGDVSVSLFNIFLFFSFLLYF